MTIKEQIRCEMIVAMKGNDEQLKGWAKFVLGEFDRVGKEVTDIEALRVIKKLIKSEEDNKELGMDIDAEYISYLNGYIPEQVSEEDVKEWIAGNVNFSELNNKMQAVGLIKKQFGESVDGKMASKIIQEM